MLPGFQCEICLTTLSQFSFLSLYLLFLLSLAVYFGHAACAVHPGFWPNICIVFVLKILTSILSFLPVSLPLAIHLFPCFACN